MPVEKEAFKGGRVLWKRRRHTEKEEVFREGGGQHRRWRLAAEEEAF